MSALTNHRQSSLVKINTETLRAARITVSCSPEVQGLFDQAVTEEWDTQTLADVLTEALPEYMLDHTGIAEAAQYLAEEFTLRDKNQTLLVSAETGLAVGQVPPDTLYQPDAVEREFTDKLAVPLKRLKPEVEAAIIQAQFNRGHEEKIVQALSKRAISTELQAQTGDPRLQVATYQGRKKLAARMRLELPELLTGGSGMVRDFLNCCVIGLPEEAPGLAHQLRITAHAAVPLTDMLSLNLQHDPYTALKERVRNQWARNIARQVALFAYCQLTELVKSIRDELPEGLLICDPDTAIAIPSRPSLAVEGVPAVIISKGPFLGIAPDAYVLESIERQGRWEIAAGFDVALNLDLEAIQALHFTDVPISGLTVEVV